MGRRLLGPAGQEVEKAMDIDPLGIIESAIGQRATGVQNIPLAQITPNPAQPRQKFNEAGLEELAASIRQHGLLQPLVVQPAPDGSGYVLLCGERRWRAAQMAGLQEVPVVMHEPVDVATGRLLSLVENLQREDLNDMERAEAIVALKQELDVSWEELARRLGMSVRRVLQLAALTRLADPVKALIEEGRLTARHAQHLGRLRDGREQAQLAQKAARQQWSAERVAQEVAARLKKQQEEKRQQRKEELQFQLASLRVQDVAGVEPILEVAALLYQSLEGVEWEKLSSRQRKRAREILKAAMERLAEALDQIAKQR